MKTLHLALLGASLFAVSACATVTKGTDDDVKFVSSPDGAKVTAEDITGKEEIVSCVTPCDLALNRKWTYNILFEKEGYEPTKARLEPKFSGDGAAGMAGNVLLGGVVGAAVDASTGAMNDLKPNPLSVVLTPLEAVEESVVEADASEAPETTEDTAVEPVS